MSDHLHEALHSSRAAQFEREAATSAMSCGVRRARRLENLATLFSLSSRWSGRLAVRLTARARASRARLP